MDAVEYVKARCRLCKSKDHCYECPLYENGRCIVGISIVGTSGYAEKAVQIVEQWAKEHPVKTRQSELLKMFPNASIIDGVLIICPMAIDKALDDSKRCYETTCHKCLEKYWLAEVTDND